jgi:hypothetical protein
MPIQTKADAVNWLDTRLEQEAPRSWADRERRDLAEKLAQDYQPGGPRWRVKESTQSPEGTPVYVVTGRGVFGIYSVTDPEKAEAVARTLNALDTEMRPPKG